MDLLAAWLLFPLVVGLLSLGCGLLVQRAAGPALPGALLVPLGLATIFVAVRLATATSATARFALPLVLALAAAGALLGWRRLAGLLPDPWVAAAALGAFAVYGAPVFMSGEPTFAGYALLPDTSHQLSLADLFARYGPDYLRLPEGSNQVSLTTYVATAYPVGAQATLGALAPLGILDMAWLYQPFLTILATCTVLCLHALVRPWVPGRALSALIAFTSGCAALTLSYALQGSIKEIAAVTMLTLTAATCAPALALEPPRARSLLPPMLASVAAYGSLGPAIAPYLGLMLGALAVAWVVRVVRGRSWIELVRAVGVAVLAAVLALPMLAQVSTAFAVSVGTLANAESGNLPGALNPAQAFGIWLNGDYRYPPGPAKQALWVGLTAVAALAAVIGLGWSLRRRALGPLLLTGSMGLATLVLLPRGNVYADGKVLALLAPSVLLMSMLGIAALRDARRGVLATLLGATLAGSVLLSNALAYHDVQLAPYDRYSELLRLDERLAGQGPTIFTEYDEFGKYFLRRSGGRNQPEYPHTYQPSFTFADTNRRPSIKTPLDLDELQLPYIQSVPQIVMRRSPTVTRPPSNYRRTFVGKYYELWERVAGTEGSVRAHLPLGPNVFEPGATPDCRLVRAMATQARRIGGALAYVRRPEVLLTRPRLDSPAWYAYFAYPHALVPVRAGSFISEVSSKTGGQHSVWIEGSFGREVRVLVNGRDVGSVRNETGNPGQYFRIGSIDLPAGPSSVRVVQKGGDARPGNGGWDSSLRHIGPVALSAPANDRRKVEWMEPDDARELCDQRLDWIEVVEGGRSS